MRQELEQAMAHLEKALQMLREPDAPVFRHKDEEERETDVHPQNRWEVAYFTPNNWSIINTFQETSIIVKEGRLKIESKNPLIVIPLPALVQALQLANSTTSVL